MYNDGCMYICLISYVCLMKRDSSLPLIAGQVPVYILRPEILVQLYFT